MRISLLLILTILSSNSNSFIYSLSTPEKKQSVLENLQRNPLFNLLFSNETNKYNRLIDDPVSFINDSIQVTSRKQFAETIKDIKEHTENDVFLGTLEKVLHKKIEKIEQIHNYGVDIEMLISGGKWLTGAAISYYLLSQCRKHETLYSSKPIAVIPAGWGTWTIYNGLTAPDEYENLEKAKDFLKIVQGFRSPQK
jgi:hypothetical protein